MSKKPVEIVQIDRSSFMVSKKMLEYLYNSVPSGTSPMGNLYGIDVIVGTPEQLERLAMMSEKPANGEK